MRAIFAQSLSVQRSCNSVSCARNFTHQERVARIFSQALVMESSREWLGTLKTPTDQDISGHYTGYFEGVL